MSDLMNNLLNQVQEKMKKYLETKDLVYGEDYEEGDLIQLNHYLEKKENPDPYNNYQSVLITKPYFSIRYQDTETTRILAYQEKMIHYHSLFNQKIEIEILKKMDFQKLFLKNKSLQMVKTQWTKINNHQPHFPSLYLHGGFDTGKTFFFKRMIQSLIHNRQDFLFLKMIHLPRKIKEHLYDEEIDKKMNLLSEIPYLFLDNLGAEALTLYLRDNILFPFLDMRYEKRAHTFINSNFDLPQLIHHFIIKSEEKEKMRALRIIHKLKKCVNFILLINQQ
ncbi:MAG: hypothetical protein Q8885_02305 [Candidatus Phytoplasma stylosanthis]|nr:hypothetical protein [Candidatus Phytoplasma stylosanthis]